MTKSKINPEQKIEELGDAIKKQFEEIGNDVKRQLLEDFDSILSSDLNGLKDILNKIVREQSKRLLSQSQKDLQKTIEEDFGGSVFGNILSEAIIPNLGMSGNNQSSSTRSSDFKASSSQAFLEMAKAIARSQSRNG